jgi:hypothetical protein
MSNNSLSICLSHPLRQIREFNSRDITLSDFPYKVWVWLLCIAVIGSGIYGASLALVLPWNFLDGALWLILSAGAGWCVFIPAIIIVTNRKLFVCFHACLVTMAYGEAVLLFAAAINLLISASSAPFDPAAINLGMVGVSNVVMAAALAAQLRVLDVPIWKSIAAWVLFLNGSGALFFRLFQRLLQGGV